MSDQAGNDAGDRDGAAGASGADRLTAPPDAGQQPRLPFPVVGVGASAGGLEAYTELLQAAPPDAGIAWVLIQHLPPDRDSLLTDILAKQTAMPVLQVEDGTAVEPDHVYVIRPGHTLTIRDGRLRLGKPVEAPGHCRPVDDFFRSVAEEQQQRAVAVILSGMGSNGTAGAEAVKAVGGLCIAQAPETAKFPSMPRSLIDAHLADYVLRPADVPGAVARYARHPYAAGDGSAAEAARKAAQALTDILAVVRARTGHDFAGYRKPTLVRRVQRRMGLSQVEELGDYAAALRQAPAEVTALADDLLIHVTGFFRDPDAWEALREKVVMPLAAERSDGAPVRAWVAACATGEEAYSLAILLTEAAEARGKQFDIKVFATDMAERALGRARAGVFPGGIESEVTADRLDRFFDKDDSMYRVKRELRERVIFAPQNVLQDPPFSRLDIVTCRNLFIYLEPEVQRRVLGLLHFGLRDGGALLLGSSESVGAAEEFEPIDKKHRLFRRVGPAKPGALEFPAPPALAPIEPARPPPQPVALAANKALLEHHTPAAVVVDRGGQIVYFHGDTARYLNQPRGEPTRDLLALAAEPVRGAARTALHQAAGQNRPVVVRDGLLDTPEGRRRVEVAVTPLDRRPAPPLFLVAFSDHAEKPPAPPPTGDPTAEERLIEELQRVRDELQSTVEEHQTTNEEMKASHEELTSVNEELQSTNEELETSKEELQSLNEELATVNAQLQAKMEELEATSNDLASLLTSTDIAVVFLDARFRIRRFTPAVSDLFDLIPSDAGRPLTDLRRKFADPDLLADAQAVLERLIPVERVVKSDSGRWYARRVLPYRTADRRIDGVVVTFVDTTDRKRAADELRASEERFRAVAAHLPGAAVFVVGPDLRYRMAEGQALRDAGLTPADFEGKALAEALPPDRLADHERTYRQALAGEPFAWEHEAHGRHFVTHGLPLRDAAGAVTAALAVSYDITDRVAAEAAVKAARDELEVRVGERTAELAGAIRELETEAGERLKGEDARVALLRRLETAQEEERRRIARELHDSLGQYLAAMALGLKVAETQAGPDSPAAARLKQLAGLTQQVGRETHRLALELRPTALDDAGLPAALRNYVEAWAERSGIPAEFTSTGPDRKRFPPEAETTIYRAAQEALTNVLKHAEASRVSVVLRQENETLTLIVEDNGKGFDSDTAIGTPRAVGGLGLVGMRERVALVGGTLDIESQATDGTTLYVRVPVSAGPGGRGA